MGIFNRKKSEKTSEQPKPKKTKEVTAKEATSDFIKASLAFEESRIEMVEKSKTMAWRVALGACAIAVALVIAIVSLLPLKEVRPYVVRVDNNTGQTDIVTVLGETKSDYTEEMSKYFASLYVQKLESYDWYTIQSQVDQLMMFSDNNMKNRVNNLFKMETAPHKQYQDKQRVEVKINSTSFIGEQLIQIRFTKSIVPIDGGKFDSEEKKLVPEPVKQNFIATLGYEYLNVPTVDEIRRVNPVGFTVVSYRVDQDGGF